MKIMCALATLVMLATADVSAADVPDSSPATGANCEIGEMPNSFALSPETFAISGDLFKALCSRSTGPLVNGMDSRLKGHLKMPQTPIVGNPPKCGSCRNSPKSGEDWSVVIAYIVETDGRVSWVSVLNSTGNREVDASFFWLTKNSTYKIPALLDGMPARVYLVQRLSIKNFSSAVPLPAR
jgi:hypothetical protein